MQDKDMKQRIYILTILLAIWPSTGFSGLFGPSNYWECILEEMPGVKNDPAAIEIMRKCQKDFPDSPSVEKKGSLFGGRNCGGMCHRIWSRCI